MKKSTVALLLLIFTFISCAQDNQPALSSDDAISKEAQNYLDTALALMKDNSYRAELLDWESIKARTYAAAAGAQTPADTYPAIKQALKMLEDDHSFFLEPKTDFTNVSKRKTDLDLPFGKIISGNYAYLWVSGFMGNQEQSVAFADLLQAQIKVLKNYNPRGWIIDLRNNTGGNMWPMIAGLGPVLGTEKLGSFVKGSKVVSEWYYKDGTSLMQTDQQYPACQSTFTDSQLIEDSLPVAVLTGERTASSGEAVTVAFVGKKNVRTFGLPTRGMTTANRGHKLPDGAMLFIAGAVYVDRSGKHYGAKITPDVETVYDTENKGIFPSDDPTIKTAIEWIDAYNPSK